MPDNDPMPELGKRDLEASFNGPPPPQSLTMKLESGHGIANGNTAHRIWRSHRHRHPHHPRRIRRTNHGRQSTSITANSGRTVVTPTDRPRNSQAIRDHRLPAQSHRPHPAATEEELGECSHQMVRLSWVKRAIDVTIVCSRGAKARHYDRFRSITTVFPTQPSPAWYFRPAAM